MNAPSRFFGLVLMIAIGVGAIQADDHVLSVTVPATTFRLGEPIPLTIVHENRSSSPWKLIQPNKTHFVRLSYLPIDKKEPIGGGAYGMWFGPLFTEYTNPRTGEKIGFIDEAPVRPKIVIAPHEAHRFTFEMYDVENASRIIPGRWNAWVENKLEKLESARTEFQIVFSTDSVDMLFDVAASERWSNSARNAAIRWLKKVKPKTPVLLPSIRHPRYRATPQEIEQYEEFNRTVIANFADWWQVNRDSDAVRESIDAVNREYGLDPAQARADVAKLPPRPADALYPANKHNGDPHK